MLLMQLYTSHSIRQNNLGGIKSDKEHVRICDTGTNKLQRYNISTTKVLVRYKK